MKIEWARDDDYGTKTKYKKKSKSVLVKVGNVAEPPRGNIAPLLQNSQQYKTDNRADDVFCVTNVISIGKCDWFYSRRGDYLTCDFVWKKCAHSNIIQARIFQLISQCLPVLRSCSLIQKKKLEIPSGIRWCLWAARNKFGSIEVDKYHYKADENLYAKIIREFTVFTLHTNPTECEDSSDICEG